MQVTKLHIASRRGANRRPSSGDVWYADGKTYSFLLNVDGDAWHFFTQRKRHGCWELMPFKPAAARVAALETALEG